MSAEEIRCDRCEEPVDEQWCTHGAVLCPECLWVCSDCNAEFAESRAYDDSRD
jgi:hypothetical protein